MGQPAIEASGLGKHYGATAALDDFDLEVPPGTVCGLLGPNGAGKTTAVRILATLLRPDRGWARIAGADIATEPHEVRRRIGLSGQAPAVDEILSGRQNLVLFARLNRLGRAAAERRADELLARFDLTDASGRSVKQYSGGMRRRLDLAVTLLLAPAVLFLDEPTTGLDPRNRNEVWQAVRSLVAAGTTVLLTTQYLDEADQLADHIVVIDAGRRIAAGTPDELKGQVGGERLDVIVAHADDVPVARAIVGRLATATPEVDRSNRRVSAPVASRVAALTEVLQDLAEHGVEVDDIGLRRPTLDDVFLHLTGRRTNDQEHARVNATIALPPTPTGAAGRLRWALRDGALVAQRDMAQWVREPQLIVWGLVFPVMSVLLFAYVFGSGIVVPGGGDYTQFLMPGIFAQTMAFGVGETLAAVQADTAKGVTDRFRSMPMAPSAVVLGRCVAGMVYSAASLVLLALTGLAIGWRWTGTWGEALAAFALLLLLRLAFLWIGIWLGLKAKSPEMANSIYGALYPVTMLSSAFIAPELMPSWLGTIAEWNPLSATIGATRELFGNPSGDGVGWIGEHAMLMAVVWPLLITAVTLPLAVRSFQRLSR